MNKVYITKNELYPFYAVRMAKAEDDPKWLVEITPELHARLIQAKKELRDAQAEITRVLLKADIYDKI